jgi:hypothetical protein
MQTCIIGGIIPASQVQIPNGNKYTGEDGMDIIWDIGLDALKILSVVVGILGIALSLLLLFSPSLTLSISKLCNRYVDFDQKILYLDKEIRTERLVYRHNLISGSFLIVGSAFTIVILFYKLDVTSFLTAFFGSKGFSTFNEIILSTFALVGKVAGVVGMIIGSILLFNPGQMKNIENKMNTWFATQPVVEKLDQSHRQLDTMIYQRPLLFGSIGLIASILLTVLAITNILS